jgi:hypothetical protein
VHKFESLHVDPFLTTINQTGFSHFYRNLSFATSVTSEHIGRLAGVRDIPRHSNKAAGKKRQLKPGRGAVKGASFERSVCKSLSLWVSGGLHEDWFWRSAMSGGRATVGQRTGKHLAWHAGDISPTAPGAERLSEFFYIECKCVKSLDLNSWIFRRTGRGLQFWKDACVKANIYNKYPMLIAKENVTRTLLIVPSSLPNIEVAPAALARLPDATFYDYETVLSQAFWLAPR